MYRTIAILNPIKENEETAVNHCMITDLTQVVAPLSVFSRGPHPAGGQYSYFSQGQTAPYA